MCKAGAQQAQTVRKHESLVGLGHIPLVDQGGWLMEEKLGMPRPRGAKPSLAAGSGSSAVAVGKGGVLHALCAAMWL